MSGKTDYLLVGTRLEDGRAVTEGSKYRTALEKGVKLLTEGAFLDLIQSSNPSGTIIDWSLPTSTPSSASSSSSSSGKGVASGIENTANASNIQLSLQLDSQRSSSSSFKPSMSTQSPLLSSTAVSTSNQLARPKYLTSSSSSSSSSSSINKANDTDSLWVDKYKPGSTAEIIGSVDIAKKLTDWLRSWHKVHVEKSVKIPFSKVSAIVFHAICRLFIRISYISV